MVIVPSCAFWPVRLAHAVRGLEVVLPHQPAHSFRRGADPLDPEFCPGFPVPFAMKGRGFEDPADVADQEPYAA